MELCLTVYMFVADMTINFTLTLTWKMDSEWSFKADGPTEGTFWYEACLKMLFNISHERKLRTGYGLEDISPV